MLLNSWGVAMFGHSKIMVIGTECMKDEIKYSASIMGLEDC